MERSLREIELDLTIVLDEVDDATIDNETAINRVAIIVGRLRSILDSSVQSDPPSHGRDARSSADHAATGGTTREIPVRDVSALTDLRRLSEAATPGEWIADRRGVWRERRDEQGRRVKYVVCECHATAGHEAEQPGNPPFIAAAVNYVRALLAARGASTHEG